MIKLCQKDWDNTHRLLVHANDYAFEKLIAKGFRAVNPKPKSFDKYNLFITADSFSVIPSGLVAVYIKHSLVSCVAHAEIVDSINVKV